MMRLSKRTLFTNMSAVALVTVTGGCTTTQVGTQTSSTLNVAKIYAYIEATTNGANTVISMLEQVPGLSQYIAPIHVLLDQLNSATEVFGEATADHVTINYNSANMRPILSMLFDIFKQLAVFIGKTVLVNLTTTNAGVSSTIISRIRVIYNALATLVSILKATLYPVYAQLDVDSHRQVENQALHILNA